jgi:hypothetical protein
MLIIRQHHETPDVPAACISGPLSTPGLAVRRIGLLRRGADDLELRRGIIVMAAVAGHVWH